MNPRSRALLKPVSLTFTSRGCRDLPGDGAWISPSAMACPLIALSGRVRTLTPFAKYPAPKKHCHINELEPPFSSLFPEFGAGQQARLAFPDLEPPTPDPCIISRRLYVTMPREGRHAVPVRQGNQDRRCDGLPIEIRQDGQHRSRRFRLSLFVIEGPRIPASPHG